MAACCRIINKKHSTHFEVTSFVKWRAWETANISKDEFFRTLDDAWNDWRTIPPTEEHLSEQIGRMLEFSKVDIVTGRSPETVASAKSWLRNQEIKFNGFVRTNSGQEKAELDYQIFIDDSPELMLELTSKPARCGILYTQPWNKDMPTMQQILRVDSWAQIPERVHAILNGRERV
jgi:hypothetical protein